MTKRIEASLLQHPGTPHNVRHGFFTREGGVSSGIYASLNSGTGSQDLRERVLENRARIASAINVAAENLITPYQIHSPNVVVASQPWQPGEGPRADAIVSTTKNLAIGVLTADCTPVLFADPEAGIIAAAHAGWRGALDGVLEATVKAMTALGASNDSIYVAIGPTISQQSYEVGNDFRDKFLERDNHSARYFIDGPEKRPHFDLPGYVAARLKGAGMRHIQDLGLCTYRDETRFFSYRRTTHRGEADYGRQISVITM